MTTTDYNREFINACRDGDLAYLRQLYLEHKEDINIASTDECAFRIACANGHLDIIRQLYQWQPTIDISARGEYALRHACRNGHIEVVRQLYEWRPTIDISLWNEDAFCQACKYGHFDIVKQLVEWRPNINIKCASLYHIPSAEIRDYLNNIKSNEKTWLNTIIKLSDDGGMIFDCPICRCDSGVKGYVETPCGHKYCPECISLWLERSDLCPYCRRLIVPC